MDGSTVKKSWATTEWWLRRALVACIGVPLVLFLCAAAFDRRQLLNEATRETERTSDVMQEHALRVLDTHSMLVNSLDHGILGMTWDEIRADRSRLLLEARNAIADRPQVTTLALTDGQGRQWVLATKAEKQAPEGQNAAFREYWAAQREANQGMFVSRPYVGQNTGRLNFAISKRRTKPDGSFDGTVHVAVTVAYFQDFWATATRGMHDASVSLVRSDGEVLARFPELREGTPRLKAPTSGVMSALAIGRLAGTFRTVSPVDGVERIVAFRKIPAFPVTITTSVAVSSVLAEWWRDLAVLGAVSLTAALALGFAVLAAIRQTRRLAAEQDRRAAAELVAREGQQFKLLGHLAAGVAHDFRNILQSIASSAELMTRQVSDDRVRGLLHIVDKAVAQGNDLTRRMLSVAQSGREQDSPQDIWEDAVQAVSNACELTAGTVGATHKLKTEVPTDAEPLYVNGLGSELEAAVINLVMNARDASAEGATITVRVVGEHVSLSSPNSGCEVDLHIARSGLYARVSVADAGHGMTPEVLARATEAFFTTKQVGRGAGLGLAGVRSFAERAGGHVALESAVGIGTTVTLWLPAANRRPDTKTDTPDPFSDNPLLPASNPR